MIKSSVLAIIWGMKDVYEASARAIKKQRDDRRKSL